jgi:hypothetical protein
MMPEDIEALQRWMVHPDTNRSVMDALHAEYMSDADTMAVMKVLNVVLREEQ